MSVTTNGKNAMLDALDIASLSLHTGFPGTTGANEVTGGSYARVAVTFSAAALSQRNLTAAAAVSVPAGTIRWAGLWAADGTTFQAYAPNGGAPKEFVAIASTDVVTSLAHGFTDTQTIVFYGGTPPAPLVEGTVYYARDATADTFKVAATSGGAAIDLTDGGSSDCVVARITEEVYGASGTHNILTWVIGLTH